MNILILHSIKKKTIYPKELNIRSDAYNRVLVLTPHADDETFGCGGTIWLSTQSKKQVKVICISDNIESIKSDTLQPNEIKYLRFKEFKNAMNILGVDDFQSLAQSTNNFRDITRMEKILQPILIEYKPDVLYVPSVIDNHSEHRILHLITFRILSNQKQIQPTIRMYEVWSTIYPNVIVDISECIGMKIHAMQSYSTQTKNVDYQHHILGLNAYRAMTRSMEMKYVEGFSELSKEKYLHYVKQYLAN